MYSHTLKITVLLLVFIVSVTWSIISIRSGVFVDIPSALSASAIGGVVLKYIDSFVSKLRSGAYVAQSSTLKYAVLILAVNTAVTWAIISIGEAKFVELPTWMVSSNLFGFVWQYMDGSASKLFLERQSGSTANS